MKIYTLSQGMNYASNYCSKEERCQKDVKEKLLSKGLTCEEADTIVAELITEGFINEVRYARLFTLSKLHQNLWGRIKIRQMLKLKGISAQCIDIAFKEINDEEYRNILSSLCHKKLKNLKTNNRLEQNYKLKTFLYSHGFEMNIIDEVILAIND